MPLDGIGVTGNNREHGSDYWPSPYRLVEKMLAALEPEMRRQAFVDFGCGKGRVLWLAARSGFSRVIGVEFSNDLCLEARKLVARTRIAADVINEDAAGYKIPVTGGVFYFFHPFDETIMDRVARNIIESWSSRPREIRVIYVNAVHLDVFKRNGFAELKSIKTCGGRTNVVLRLLASPRTD